MDNSFSVTPTIEEPFKGWIDSFCGLMGLTVAASAGLIRTTIADMDAMSDYLPADVAVKSMIAAAWKTAVFSSQGPSSAVYNCASVLKPLKYRYTMDIGLQAVHEFPLYKAMWLPSYGAYTTNKISFRIHNIFENLLLAALFDIGLKIRGQKPMLVKLLCRSYQGLLSVAYFSLQSWTFINQNLRDLNAAILPEDKEHFDFDVYDACIDTYLKFSYFGARKFLLDDDVEKNLSKARKQMSRMYWTEKVFQAAAVIFALWMINTIMDAVFYQHF